MLARQQRMRSFVLFKQSLYDQIDFDHTPLRIVLDLVTREANHFDSLPNYIKSPFRPSDVLEPGALVGSSEAY